MKKLLFTCLAIAVTFATCKKEEETPPNNTPTTYAFSCKIDGADFTDNNPVASVNASDVLMIDAENGGNTIRMVIYNFSYRNVDEEISLIVGNIISCAFVTKDGIEYTNTQSGKLIFSKIDAKLSGTFEFISEDPDNVALPVEVSEGEFVDVAY